MTNTGPGNFPNVTSSDSSVEKSMHEEVSLENSERSNMSTTDDAKSKESSYKGRNFVKHVCWFFMSHNYCRYGKNCKFSHGNPHTPEFLCRRNSGYEEHRVSNSKTGSKAGNLKQNINSKESFHCASEDEIKVQNRPEKVSDSVTKPCHVVSSHSDNYAYKYGDSIARHTLDATTSIGDNSTNQSNVQMSHQSSGRVRQRNLYFYRSNYRSKPSDSPRIRTRSLNCRYFSKGFCRQGNSCKFLHQTNDRCDSVEESVTKLVEESIVSENGKSTTAGHNELQLKNCGSVPVTRQLVKLQDVDQKNIQGLRDTEIQQLKKRFPTHELIKSSPEEVLHVTFCPSDPDWSFAVNSVSLEVAFSKEYPREACTIKVLEADNLPPLLVWHLNKSVSEWIKEKHQSAVASGKIELLFRPFLRWFDRNLEELFLVGLRKVKQDLLAKEAGIEFVPYEELPGASLKVNKQDDCLSTSQKSDDTDLTEKAEQNSESENMRYVQHINDDHDSIQEKSVTVISEVKADYPPASAEKENEYPTCANTSFDKVSIPKLGTEVKLLGLELRESAAAMVCTKIAASLQCGRCKTRHEINTPPKRNNTLNCIKCHHSMQIVFQPSMLHQFSAVVGYLHLVECQAVDIPLMECNFTVDCLNCSKQMNVNGIHYGQQRVTWCLHCNKKLSIYTQSVKFHQLQPASNIVSPGHKLTTVTKKEKKIMKDPAIQEGKPLPDCGTCKHYKKSYRWLRFPCCGKAYPCDVCHNEKETDHEMKYASRMICGFCAKEQPYAGNKPCISCSSNMAKKAGAHWEGGRGCRDKIAMSREDRQKYAGMSKTTSRKAQSQNPSKY